jgi:hypothetical protein
MLVVGTLETVAQTGETVVITGPTAPIKTNHGELIEASLSLHQPKPLFAMLANLLWPESR